MDHGEARCARSKCDCRNMLRALRDSVSSVAPARFPAPGTLLRHGPQRKLVPDPVLRDPLHRGTTALERLGRKHTIAQMRLPKLGQTELQVVRLDHGDHDIGIHERRLPVHFGNGRYFICGYCIFGTVRLVDDLVFLAVKMPRIVDLPKGRDHLLPANDPRRQDFRTLALL